MAKRPFGTKVGPDLETYIERVSHRTGLNYAEILRRSVQLAKKSEFFDVDQYDPGQDSAGEAVDTAADSNAHLEDTARSSAAQREGRVAAADLAQQAAQQSAQESGDAPQPQNPDSDGDGERYPVLRRFNPFKK